MRIEERVAPLATQSRCARPLCKQRCPSGPIDHYQNPACLKGAFAKGCFLAFDVLRGEAPFVLSIFLGGFVLSTYKNYSRRLLGGETC